MLILYSNSLSGWLVYSTFWGRRRKNVLREHDPVKLAQPLPHHSSFFRFIERAGIFSVETKCQEHTHPSQGRRPFPIASTNAVLRRLKGIFSLYFFRDLELGQKYAARNLAQNPLSLKEWFHSFTTFGLNQFAKFLNVRREKEEEMLVGVFLHVFLWHTYFLLNFTSN